METERKYKKELKRFDPILKEIFSKAAGKLISIATGEKIKEKLEDIKTEIEFVKSLRPDLLFRAREKIFHIEIQVQTDKNLPERMLIYSLAIKEKFGQKPTQIILFVGKGNPPPSFFRDEFTIHKFIVLDMKKIDPDEFIKSDKPEEVILGVLAGKYREKPDVFNKVVRKISKIIKNEKELLKYMEDISFLGGLFDVEIKAEHMPIQIDIRKTLFYKWGEKRGLEKGLKEGEKRGKQEGLKEAILLGAQIKFGKSKIKELKNLLEKVDDLNHLKKIKRKIIEAKNWDDFVKSFKTTNSKNKNSKGK
jgi:predicted transposase YdaD